MEEKLFRITLFFDLSKKPAWLEEFRKKYDEPLDYHVTLKYPVYIQDQNIDQLKIDLQELTSMFKPISVIFDQYFFNQTRKGFYIMVTEKSNEDLIKLQKEIISRFGKFNKYFSPDSKARENDYKLHITIGRKLTKERFEEAKKKLKIPIFCKARIDTLTLTIMHVQENSLELVNESSFQYELSSK